MRYVAAYLLAVLGGNASPSNADIEKILSSVGIEVDATRVTKVVGELKGKSIDELIAQGREKLSSMPAGGGAVSAAPAAGKFIIIHVKIHRVLITMLIFRWSRCPSSSCC